MIKFVALVHKQTGTVIKYEEWLQEIQKQPGVTSQPVEKQISNKEKLIYRPKEALYSDSFEIIYDSEFTLEELGIIFRCNQKYCEKLMEKICKGINNKELLMSKYRIEV